MWPDAENTEQLLASARQGEPEAVNQLLERHRESVRRMIDLRMDQMLKRRVDASDIVQDVMIEANRRLQAYLQDPVLPFHLWLRQMAKDRLIDAHRRHRGAARRSLDREQPVVAQFTGESSLDLLAQLRDQELTPAAAATWNELQRRFEAACQQLDPQDQEIVLMRHFEHLTNAEAATVLNLSPQAASMRYLRAMRRLREVIQDVDPAGASS
ncbi:MAG: sigma-70 family RNA polymerase sigma factor [Planctomycetales bacterium]|nr:sigma-70 family RNA polymerase sigma factor [Planctomycetales bacterium]